MDSRIFSFDFFGSSLNSGRATIQACMSVKRTVRGSAVRVFLDQADRDFFRILPLQIHCTAPRFQDHVTSEIFLP